MPKNENREDINSSNFSRRDFLRSAGIVAGGTAIGAELLLAGCSDTATL